MENRTFIMGDIHGMYDKLMACLQAVSFDYTNDTLIQLGDVVDRGPDSYLVVEELLKIKNLIAIRGNHDDTFYKSIITGNCNILFNQGGKETLESYIKYCNSEKSYVYNEIRDKYETDFDLDDYPTLHIRFFKNQLPYYIDKNNNCFVHGGFNRHTIIENQIHNDLLWDRDLWHAARSYDSMINKEQHPFKNKNKFNEIFIGHTPTTYFNSTVPYITPIDSPYRKLFSSCNYVLELSIKVDRKYGIVGKQKMFLSHYGHRVWNKSHHGSIHLFGHSHGTLPMFGKSMDVGVDTNNLYPYHLDEIMNIMSNQKIEIIDHHNEKTN